MLWKPTYLTCLKQRGFIGEPDPKFDGLNWVERTLSFSIEWLLKAIEIILFPASKQKMRGFYVILMRKHLQSGMHSKT
jgi:hypothetical protein